MSPLTDNWEVKTNGT